MLNRLDSLEIEMALAIRDLRELAVDQVARSEEKRSRLSVEIEKLNSQVGVLTEQRDTALRHREMFRSALFVYLQERDGPAGVHAPTPETLREMRKLIETLES